MEQGEAPWQDEPDERGTECAFRWDIEQMTQSGVGKKGNENNKNAGPNKAQAQLRQGWLGIVFIGQTDFPCLHGEGLAFFVPVGAEVEPPCVEQNQAGCQHGQARGNGIEKDGDNTGCKGGNAGHGAGQQKFVNQCGEAAFEWGGGKAGHNAMETKMGLMAIKTGRLKRDRMFRRPVTVVISDVDVFDRVPVGQPFGSFPDGSDVF